MHTKTRLSLGDRAEDIYKAFIEESKAWVGRRITEAEIIGAGKRFRVGPQDNLDLVVGEIGVRDVSAQEAEEFYEAIELGQVQIYLTPLWVSGGTVTRTVIHQATGVPLDSESAAARRQRQRFESARLFAEKVELPSLANDEYLRASGNKCPACGGSDVEARGLEAEGLEALSNVQCNKCNANWNDAHKLTGYVELEEPPRATTHPEDRSNHS